MRFLLYWKEVFVTEFHNRVWQVLFGRSPYDLGVGKDRTLPTEPLQVLFDGRVERWETFEVCRDVIVDFDRCKPTSKKRSPLFFEEGFIRIGDRVSPPSFDKRLRFEFDRWRRTCEPAPAAVEFAPGKTVLVSGKTGGNIALNMRLSTLRLHAFKRAGISEDEELLISPARCRDGAELELHGKSRDLTGGLFSTEEISSGVFLFPRVIFVSSRATKLSYGSARFQLWQAGDLSASLRRRALATFGIESRERVGDVGRITLVSRQDCRQSPSGRVFHLKRKISNEDEIVAALRERFPDAEVTKVALEHLPMREQLSRIHRTDILIGMHGAAFGLCSMLPPNAGVLELLPASFMHRHWASTFYWVVVNNQCHYRRWINLNPWREFSSGANTRRWLMRQAKLRRPQDWKHSQDFTEVPSSAVVRKVEALRRRIRKTAH